MGLSVQVGLLAELVENDPEGAEWLREGFIAANKILSDAHSTATPILFCIT
jgi:hypothetical protein